MVIMVDEKFHTFWKEIAEEGGEGVFTQVVPLHQPPPSLTIWIMYGPEGEHRLFGGQHL